MEKVRRYGDAKNVAGVSYHMRVREGGRSFVEMLQHLILSDDRHIFLVLSDSIIRS